MSIQLEVNQVPAHGLLRRFAHVPLWILALLVIASCAQQPPVFPDEPGIRVRILESQPHIHVESASGFTLRADGEEIRTSSWLTIKAVAVGVEGAMGGEGVEGDLSNETRIENRNPDAVTSHNPYGNADSNRSAASLLVTDRDGGSWQASELWLESVGQEFLVEDVPFGVGWWWGGREHRTYEGRLHVYVDSSGRLDAVLHLPMETYLKGVIPYEIGPESPLEALKAQAVAARSEIAAQAETAQTMIPGVRTRAEGGTTVVADVRHLAENEQTMSSGMHPREDIDTWLDYPPASWCNPYVHTELPNWSKANFRWTREVTFIDFREGFAAVDSLQVLERGESGRIHRLAVWQHGSATELDFELAVRQMVHPPLRSSAFRWRETETGFIFEGAGWGHGVGMCQSGAVAQALAGRDHAVILEHYFPGTRLHRMFE